MSALVFGGTGAVGSEVLRGLAQAGIRATFTWHTRADRAKALAAEYSHSAVQVDLADTSAIRRLIGSIDVPDVFLHCAAISRALPLAEIGDADWDAAQSVNTRSAFVATQALAPRMIARKKGEIVFVGALDRTQSFPIPIHFAASQGALSAMTMALAKELGPHGIRVNMLALGVLDGGLSANLDPKLVEDFKIFSALKRRGTAAEAAQVALWLALENSYVSGKVISANGGV